MRFKIWKENQYFEALGTTTAGFYVHETPEQLRAMHTGETKTKVIDGHPVKWQRLSGQTLEEFSENATELDLFHSECVKVTQYN